MSLKLYNALVKRDKNNKIENISLIKDNFSISALIFSLFWFLAHTMWWESVLFIVVETMLIKLAKIDNVQLIEILLIQIGILVVIGMNATNWYGGYLQKKKGYKKMGYVLAQNEEEARLKAMKSWHRNSPDLSFDEFGEEMIDSDFYLGSLISKNRWFKKK